MFIFIGIFVVCLRMFKVKVYWNLENENINVCIKEGFILKGKINMYYM